MCDHGFWDDEQNVLQFMRWAEEQLGITDLDEWNYISRAAFIQLGGKTLLEKFRSLTQLLSQVYPGPCSIFTAVFTELFCSQLFYSQLSHSLFTAILFTIHSYLFTLCSQLFIHSLLTDRTWNKQKEIWPLQKKTQRTLLSAVRRAVVK